MSTFALPAVARSWWQARVAFSADGLVAVVLAGQGLERGLDDAAAQAEDEVQGGFLMERKSQSRARATECAMRDSRAAKKSVGWVAEALLSPNSCRSQSSVLHAQILGSSR